MCKSLGTFKRTVNGDGIAVTVYLLNSPSSFLLSRFVLIFRNDNHILFSTLNFSVKRFALFAFVSYRYYTYVILAAAQFSAFFSFATNTAARTLPKLYGSSLVPGYVAIEIAHISYPNNKLFALYPVTDETLLLKAS